MTHTDMDDLQVEYFDGRSAQGHPAWLRVQGQVLLILAGGGDADEPSGRRELRRVDWRGLSWPDAGLSTQRMLHLPDGGMVSSNQRARWDAWVKRHQPHTQSWVHRAQTSLRWALLSAAIVVPLGVAALVWGMPRLGSVVVEHLPPEADVMAGDSVEGSLPSLGLRPSKLSAEVQARWQGLFQQAMTRSAAPGPFHYRLRFMSGAKGMGANAIALPGGQIIVTDELVALLDKLPEADREDALLGVLGHEAGHVHHRHGLRTVVAGSAAGLVISAWLGDVSTLLAAVPTAMATLSYSRDAEREADQFACALLRKERRSTRGLIALFQEMERSHDAPRPASAPGTDSPDQGDGGRHDIWSSHPATAERVQAWARCGSGQPD